MKKIRILGIGRDPVVLQKLLRFINENPNWEGSGVVDDQSALTVYKQQPFDVVFVLDDVESASADTLRNQLKELNPTATFFRHFGDSTGLFVAELTENLPEAFIANSGENVGD